jgi:hypothetical protein
MLVLQAQHNLHSHSWIPFARISYNGRPIISAIPHQIFREKKTHSYCPAQHLSSSQIINSQHCTSLILIHQKAKSFWFPSFWISRHIYIHHFTVPIVSRYEVCRRTVTLSLPHLPRIGRMLILLRRRMRNLGYEHLIVRD